MPDRAINDPNTMMTGTRTLDSPDTPTTPQPSIRQGVGASRRGWKRFRWMRMLWPVLIVGTLGFNGWWYWRDVRPVPNLATIETWLKNDRPAEAEMASREHLGRSPLDGEARTSLAKALAARGDLLGCARQLHEVPPWTRGKSEALFQEANTYSILYRAKDAEAAWLAIIKHNPLHPAPSKIFHDAAADLLELYATEDRWDDAFVVLWRAFDAADAVDHPTLLTWRIRSELERVAYSESIHKLRRYVAADPEDWEGLRALAKAEMALGLHDDADRHYRACLKGRPEDPRVLRDYLTMLYELGHQDAWAAELARVPKSADIEPEVWKFRGIAKEKAGDMAGAAEDYRRAIERNPFIVEYHYRLAMAEERLGHPQQAIQHRKTTQQLREARSDLRTAFSDYLEAQDTHSPSLPAAIERLASICRTLGFTRAADEWTKIANQLD